MDDRKTDLSTPTVPMSVVCPSCGADRTVAASAADPGPCRCGETRRVSASLLGTLEPLPPAA